MPTDVVTMDKIVSLCKRRGFIFQSSEIYGGLASTYDYGHYGVLLKSNVKAEWWRAVLQQRDDMVAFLIGCSFTFEHALVAAGIPLRHLECGDGVPMWVTNRECVPAGTFRGPLVVSMRPIREDQVERASDISARYARAHGAPVHAGDPAALGIRDLSTPDWGDPTEVRDGEVPVFWACGVTPQAVLAEVRPELAITHAPGHMFLTDLRVTDLVEAARPGDPVSGAGLRRAGGSPTPPPTRR